MDPRPLGYATVEEFEQHLDATLSDSDKTAAQLYLRMAEEVVSHHTGGREFLPLSPTVYTDIADDDTTVSLGTGADRLPNGGMVYIDSEVLRLGARTVYADHVDFAVLDRAYAGTTAAAHTATTSAYLVRGYTGTGKSLFVDDFLDLIAVWGGYPDWYSWDTEYMLLEPQSLPHQWIEYGDTFSKGSKFHVAAVWGAAYSVPYGIKLAVLRIAEEVFRRRGTHWTVVSQVQLESVATRFRDPTVLPSDVQQVLKSFKKVSL